MPPDDIHHELKRLSPAERDRLALKTLVARQRKREQNRTRVQRKKDAGLVSVQTWVPSSRGLEAKALFDAIAGALSARPMPARLRDVVRDLLGQNDDPESVDQPTDSVKEELSFAIATRPTNIDQGKPRALNAADGMHPVQDHPIEQNGLAENCSVLEDVEPKYAMGVSRSLDETIERLENAEESTLFDDVQAIGRLHRSQFSSD